MTEPHSQIVIVTLPWSFRITVLHTEIIAVLQMLKKLHHFHLKGLFCVNMPKL